MHSWILTYSNELAKICVNSMSRKCNSRTSFVTCEALSSAGNKKRLKILIAGGGIGGLVLAIAATHRGYDVKVFEKSLSAVRGEGRYRGPILLTTNALAILEAINGKVAAQIMEAGCITGDRINGLADGISGEWFVKFDSSTTAAQRGLPLSRVVCRMKLQEILVSAVGSSILSNESKVVDFVEDCSKVTVVLEDGQQYEGDILVGADGIWSEVRARLFGKQEANYSGYTCYSGLASHVPPYIDTIGYRIFLGLNQYFVATDLGNGKIQWYAMHKEPLGNTYPPSGKRERLLELFRYWSEEVTSLILETEEERILQRDIYDRDMIYLWEFGHVTLLGDAAHPMEPNLGQGGCMAIEDAFHLVVELELVAKRGSGFQLSDEIISALRRYEKKRIFRVSMVHAASRMASKSLATYKPYMELGLSLQSHQSSLQIINPIGKVVQVFLQFFLPHFNDWIFSGHGSD